jgi:hypothetical protein
MTRLSKNFTLEEFLVSQTAVRHGIDMTPPPEVVANLTRLCETVLQPLREAVNASIFISSGYRPEDLNSLIGGSRTSQHRFGNAADISVAGWPPLEVAQLIVKLELPYDQVIHEFGRWVHVGIADTLRGEELTAYKDARNKTRYVNGIHAIPDLT